MTSDLPAHAPGVALVHAEQVAREEVGLLAALGAADLDDHVLAVVRVLGQEQHLQLRLEPLDVGLGAGHLAAHLLAIVAVEVAEHLLGRLEVAGAGAQLLRRLHDGPELAVAPSDLLVASLVGDQRRVTEARFEILVLSLEVSQPIQHRSEATANNVCAG